MRHEKPNHRSLYETWTGSKTGMRVHVTWPQVSLVIRTGEMHPSGRGPFRALFRPDPVDPASLRGQAVRTPLMRGVVLDFGGKDRWDLLTMDQVGLLSALSDAGVAINPLERQMKWRDRVGY